MTTTEFRIENQPRPTGLRGRSWSLAAALAGAIAFLIGFGVGGSGGEPLAASDPVPDSTTTTSGSTTTVPEIAVPPPLPDAAPPLVVATTSAGELVALDPRTGASRVLDHVINHEGVARFGRLALSPDDATVYYAAVREGQVGVTLAVATSGTGSPREVAEGVAPALSNDGNRLATAGPPSNPSILITDLDGKDRTRLRSRSLGLVTNPTWSPDDQAIIFERVQGSRSDLFVIASSANGPLRNDATRLDRQPDDVAWGSPAWKADDLLVAVERCCTNNGYRGSRRMVAIVPERGTASSYPPAGDIVGAISFDQGADIGLQTNPAGELVWSGPDGEQGVITGDAAVADRRFTDAAW